MKEVKIGDPGEIAIKGPQVMKGYWNRPEETKKSMHGDYFLTGDVGTMDEKGFFKIVDRKKEMILVSGFNVYPNDVEKAISENPKVLEVGVRGEKKEDGTEFVRAFIVKKDPSLTEEEVINFCREKLTNYFFVVANKKDEKKLITEGNKRVVEARLSDAKFFWEKDRSKNMIKQIANLKTITFYEKIGTIYDKTQRIKNLAGFLSDELNINKEKAQVAASISKSDLCSDLVGEYPELQGVLGKYFALSQGFDEDVANSISEHYLPIGLTSALPKKPFSYSISIVDKVDSLVGFFLINENPTPIGP